MSDSTQYTPENRTRLAAMNDEELLAYQPARHGNPWMPLETAKALGKMAFKYWHLGAAKAVREREVMEANRIRINRLAAEASAVQGQMERDEP